MTDHVIDKYGTRHNDCMAIVGDNPCYGNPTAVFVDVWNGISVRIPMCEMHVEMHRENRREVRADK